MIDPKILNILKSNNQDPSYSILIQGFNQPELCDRDELDIIIHQINPSLYDIIENKEGVIETLKQTLIDNDIEIPDYYEMSINNIVQKTFTINSLLNYDQSSNLFTSSLNGTISAESNQNLPSQSINARVQNRRIKFTTKDSPELLNINNFTISDDKIIIDLPNGIQDIGVTISHDNLIAIHNNATIPIVFTPFTYNTIIDNKITIDINDIKDHITPTNTINDLDDEINAYDNIIADLQDQIDEENNTEQYNQNIQSQIETNEALKTNKLNEKQAILNKINALNFTSTNPFEINISYSKQPDITSNTIECINFELQPEINIEFLNTYKSLPGIIITIDQDSKFYSSYDTIFKKNNNGYTGVKIIFNNLKRIKKSIDVNAIIIGDRGV